MPADTTWLGICFIALLSVMTITTGYYSSIWAGRLEEEMPMANKGMKWMKFLQLSIINSLWAVEQNWIASALAA